MKFWVPIFFVMTLAICALILWLLDNPIDARQIALAIAVSAFGAPIIWFRHVHLEKVRTRKIEERQARKPEQDRERQA